MLYYLTEKRSELKVNSLKLKNFRNYDLLNVEFDGSTNIFYGNNAQGKTNILEAVYLSGTTKSHRGSKDRDMIRFGEDESHIETVVEKNGISYQIDMHLKKNSPKGIAINKMPIRKASELFGIVNLVFFSPEDLNIIKNGPAERRRFIDLELSQLDKVYLNNLSNYNRIVNQRNHLLKELSFGGKKDLSDTLEIWELQMVQYGERLIARRKERLEAIAGLIHTKVRIFTWDLSERDSIDELEKTLKTEKPLVKLLINAAGFGKIGNYSEISRQDCDRMIDLNCRAAVDITQAVIPYMKGGSHIMEVCSSSAYMPVPYLNVYAATKVFLLHYSRALRKELLPQGILVTAVCPYWIRDTEFIAKAQKSNELFNELNKNINSNFKVEKSQFNQIINKPKFL